MPEHQVFELRLVGWESDPADEFFRLLVLDYCVAQVYTNSALFFGLTDQERPKTIPVLKRGLLLRYLARQVYCIVDKVKRTSHITRTTDIKSNLLSSYLASLVLGGRMIFVTI